MLTGDKMNVFRYGFICLICCFVIFCTGCKKDNKPVINAKSGVVIHSSDFTGAMESKVATSSKRIHSPQQESSHATMKGNVINLGGGYEEIDLGPIFRDK